jgi:chaperonin GroES
MFFRKNAPPRGLAAVALAECQFFCFLLLNAKFRSPMSRAEAPARGLGRRPRFQNSNGMQEESMKFRPLHDRVVVKRIDADEKTAGGIIIPDTAKEKPQEGEVIAVGPGGRDETGKLIPIDVKVGDRVLFGKWSGTEVRIDGKELLIMKESDIMGVLVSEAARKKAA